MVAGRIEPINCNEPDCTNCPAFRYIIFEHNLFTGEQEFLTSSEPFKDQNECQKAMDKQGAIWTEALRRVNEANQPQPERPPELH